MAIKKVKAIGGCVAALLLGTGYPNTSQGDDLNLRRWDHQAHVLGSAGASYLTAHMVRQFGKETHLNSMIISLLLVNSLGFMKEMMIDKRVSTGDLKANLLGSTVGVLVFSF